MPGYGVCGGNDPGHDCAVHDLDPLDQLFYKHDNDLDAARQLQEAVLITLAVKKADEDLEGGLAKLTDEDMDKIPFFIPHWPFFIRWWAMIYRREAMKVFKN